MMSNRPIKFPDHIALQVKSNHTILWQHVFHDDLKPFQSDAVEFIASRAHPVGRNNHERQMSRAVEGGVLTVHVDK